MTDFVEFTERLRENTKSLFLTGSCVDFIGFADAIFRGNEKTFLSFPQAERKLIANSAKPRRINGAERSIKYIIIGLAAGEACKLIMAGFFSFFRFWV